MEDNNDSNKKNDDIDVDVVVDQDADETQMINEVVTKKEGVKPPSFLQALGNTFLMFGYIALDNVLKSVMMFKFWEWFIITKFVAAPHLRPGDMFGISLLFDMFILGFTIKIEALEFMFRNTKVDDASFLITQSSYKIFMRYPFIFVLAYCLHRYIMSH